MNSISVRIHYLSLALHQENDNYVKKPKKRNDISRKVSKLNNRRTANKLSKKYGFLFFFSSLSVETLSASFLYV